MTNGVHGGGSLITGFGEDERTQLRCRGSKCELRSDNKILLRQTVTPRGTVVVVYLSRDRNRIVQAILKARIPTVQIRSGTFPFIAVLVVVAGYHLQFMRLGHQNV